MRFPDVRKLFRKDSSSSSGEEIEDRDAEGLSHVGSSAYEVLRTKHNWHHKMLWNVTSGVVIGEVHQTPRGGWVSEDDPEDGHDDWFPERMGEIMSRAEVWCDVMSLGPPDGLFLTKFKEALGTIAENAEGKDRPVTVRMMFGNIVGMPVNCRAVIRAVTEHLPEDANVRLWVGAWRRGTSWNHAKIIAVDGRYLHTGGHNLWDGHYLKFNPVHDLSLEMEGKVAQDGHRFANGQWAFVEKKQSSIAGAIVDRLPDSLPLVSRTRVTVSEWPPDEASEFPPKYRNRIVPRRRKPRGSIPVIALGRYGSIIPKDRPSDDAFVAMIDSARTIIRLALQDLGPVCLPGTRVPVPGCRWPHPYLRAMGRAIWDRGVDVEIALSNPGSVPGGLSAAEACYGNGWTCVDVAAEIIKTIEGQFGDVEDDDLRAKVHDNLRVCFVREGRGNAWSDGTTMGMHAKHFVVDDVCCYVGSQNLYVCDLAEWGVIIDDVDTTRRIIAEYWEPMWRSSYTGEDCDVQAVMDGLNIDRDGEDPDEIDEDTRNIIKEAARLDSNCPKNSEFFYDGSDDDDAEGEL